MAAIKAVLVGKYTLNEDSCSLISWFLRVAQRLTVCKTSPSLPSWDSDIVLGVHQHPPFEPLGVADLKWLSLKTAFLLAFQEDK